MTDSETPETAQGEALPEPAPQGREKLVLTVSEAAAEPEAPEEWWVKTVNPHQGA